MSEPHLGIVGDEAQRAESMRVAEASRTLVMCERCGGTGNEFYSMYRECSDCGGVGVVEIGGDDETK